MNMHTAIRIDRGVIGNDSFLERLLEPSVNLNFVYTNTEVSTIPLDDK